MCLHEKRDDYCFTTGRTLRYEPKDFSSRPHCNPQTKTLLFLVNTHGNNS